MNTQERHVFTIGHSTLDCATFVQRLKAHGVETLVDVRSFPGSRRMPHFGKDALQATLPAAGIQYLHMVSLGVRRKHQDVPVHDTHWRNPAFANYADYATTLPFRTALSELEALALRRPVAIMCAEALWWRCHRRIIADEMIKDGFAVTHIMDPKQAAKAEREPELPL